MERDSQRVAVIDVGSNSTRLLVADVAGGAVEEVERRNSVTRLGRGVGLSGQLSDEAVEATCEAIERYLAVCREAGALAVGAIATSAVRDASNGGAFLAELRERFDLHAQLLAGEREALLTYRGATAERPPAAPTLVIDIGGGSTELIVGTGDEVAFHCSLQAGVVRHSERHVASDPPTAAELDALATDVRGLLRDALADRPELRAEAGIAVAGTPTSLAAIELELEPYDPERVHSHVLLLATIQRQLSRLAAAPLAERVRIPGLHPDRAPTIVAGTVILIEAMRAFELERIGVSEHDILYGAALELADS